MSVTTSILALQNALGMLIKGRLGDGTLIHEMRSGEEVSVVDRIVCVECIVRLE
jgi:hypothetical protein